MKIRAAIITILFLSLTGFAASAAAADPCAVETAKYCPTYSGKDPRKFYCLQQVRSQVSNSCRQELKNVTDTMPEFIEDCAPDFHRFCDSQKIVPGDGRILACLKQHSKELALECRKRVIAAT